MLEHQPQSQQDRVSRDGFGETAVPNPFEPHLSGCALIHTFQTSRISKTMFYVSVLWLSPRKKPRIFPFMMEVDVKGFKSRPGPSISHVQ